MAAETKSKTNIYLTEAAAQALQRILNRHDSKVPFSEENHAVRFAFAYAVQKGLEPSRTSDFGQTDAKGKNWSVGTLDRTNELRSLVGVLYPDEAEPYMVVETLACRGLIQLDKDLEAGTQMDALLGRGR